ncbi:DUF7146 domain-containing protein [Teichococcus oryzae]|uniref:Uncharacterized protein n=1 Tax=Teichococcus oryzae TaxID=1608942 RepID=A0A5B2TBK8_9PROT|nr:toprim domain-containing protein [Pseudoroseomonas oryzae]KAA2211444.1 hypothetical protein F0Q34_19940 [Pseudoroseomonas oryzae]
MKWDPKYQLEEIKRRLTDRLEELAEGLLGPPAPESRRKREWEWNSTGGASLVVRGPKRGAFYHHTDGKGGGPLDLIMYALGCGIADAIRWAKSWLGMSDGGTPPPPLDAAALQERQRQRKAEDARATASEQQRIGRARTLWRFAKPVDGAVAEIYLTRTRAIPAPQLGWPQEAIRFHPDSCALVVAMTNEEGELRAVQRVYLTPDGTKISKETAKQRRLPGAKQTTGVMASANVRLPGAEDGPLLIAEGPETALSVWRATGHETWAALGGVAKVAPPLGRPVVICADDDAPGAPAAQKLRDALEGWAEEGCEVAVATPWAEPRGDKSDFNDVIQQGGVEAVRQRIAGAQPVVCTPALPHYPRPRLSGQRAGGKLRRTVRGFFDRVERRLEARDWINEEAERLEPEVKAGIIERHKAKLLLVGTPADEAEEAATAKAEKTTAKAARQRARRAARARFGRQAVGAPPRLQIAGSASLGKTSAIINEILMRPALWTRHI